MYIKCFHKHELSVNSMESFTKQHKNIFCDDDEDNRVSYLCIRIPNDYCMKCDCKECPVPECQHL